jgi:hypothetical protein
MLKNIVEACCADACEFCAWRGCMKSNFGRTPEELAWRMHVTSHVFMFRNKFEGSNFSIHPHFTK